MNVVAIVCCDPNGVIGHEGKIPWDWPEQLLYFREATMGCPVIFGHRTMRSIGKPLPGRLPIVVSHDRPDMPEGWVWQPTPKDALEHAKHLIGRFDLEKDTVFVGGGESIYREMLPFCDFIDLTQISKNYSGDARFPLEHVGEAVWKACDRRMAHPPAKVAKAGYHAIYRRRGAAVQ